MIKILFVCHGRSTAQVFLIANTRANEGKMLWAVDWITTVLLLMSGVKIDGFKDDVLYNI